MGKPLAERATSFRKSDRVTVTDLRNILPELREAAERAGERQRQAEAESVDLALSGADRDEAAAEAERAGRTARAYAEAIIDLERKLAAKLASESHKAKEAERTAALAERDQLAERFAAVVAPMCEALPELFAAVQTNAERMARSGLKEADAEAVARRVPRTFTAGAGLVDRFAQMKIPNFAGKGRCWPPEKRIDFDAHIRLGRRQSEESRAEKEAEWGWYRLAWGRGSMISFRHRNSPLGFEEVKRGLYRERWEGQIKHEEAARLRDLGASVEPIEAPALAEAEE